MARDADGRLTSRELGLALEAESPLVRLIDLRSGRRLLTYSEQAEQLAEMQRESQDAQREAQKAQRAVQVAQQEAKDAQRVAEDAQHAAAAERARRNWRMSWRACAPPWTGRSRRGMTKSERRPRASE